MILFILIFILVLIPVYSYNRNKFTIRKGTHSGVLEMCPHYGITTMERKLVLGKNCLYEDTSGEGDWNKAFGFSYGRHHKNSFRIGWRCKEGHLETCLYYYEGGIRRTIPLRIVRPNTVNTFRIDYYAETVVVKHGNPIRGYSYTKVSVTNVKVRPGYYLYPYFGGQAKAPYKMKLRIFK
jgi:hypothetical protein